MKDKLNTEDFYLQSFRCALNRKEGGIARYIELKLTELELIDKGIIDIILENVVYAEADLKVKKALEEIRVHESKIEEIKKENDL